MSTGTALRAGVVGAGWIGRRHAEALAARDDVVVAAVCDLDAARAAAVARLSGADAYSGWQEMLDAAALDALWVCTPPKAHAGPAVGALNRGLPVYLEKPIARSLEDARAIVAAATRHPVACAVGYQWHAIDFLGDLRQALAGRPVGCLLGQSVGGTASRPWFLDQAESGGNLLERGSHHIDLARALAGEVTRVQAATSSIRLAHREAGAAGDIADAITMVLHFASGGIGTIVVAWTSDGLPGRYWVELMADDAAFRLDLDPDYRLSGTSNGVPVDTICRAEPFAMSVDRFIEAVRSAEPESVFCTPADAARTLAVACAAEQAVVSGQTVAIPPEMVGS